MIVAINYADWKYKKAQKFNSKTAVEKGKVDSVICYSPKDIDVAFRKKNENILSRKRGNGYWLWKPYFIKKTMDTLKENDYLVYLDSGAFYINDVGYLIRQMENDRQYMMAFELPFKERYFTKRDIFICLDCDEPKYVETNQRMATMIILKKTEKSVQFVCDWLKYGQLEDIITDAKNHMGKNNYVGFVDNRHDQSIFSLLSKKYRVKAYRDPSQFGRFPDIFWKRKIERTEDNSTYPQIIAEHRLTEVTKKVLWEQLLFAYAPKEVIRLYINSGLYNIEKTKQKKIAMLTDNMPIKKNAYGYGMYKVVNRLVDALGNHIETIICTDEKYCENSIDVAFISKIILANKFHKIKNERIADLCFLLEVAKTAIDLRRNGISKVFIPLGADYRELKRAYLFSVVFHMSVSVYVVDDFIEHQRIILGNGKNISKLRKDIIRYLDAVDCIFVISHGMRDRIYDLTGRKSVLLPIPYRYEKNSDMYKRKMQIMILGNINKLYVQGIKDIAEVVDKINTEIEDKISLLFTYSSPIEVKRLIGNYKCISSRRIKSDEELRKEIQESMFCFMSYTDNKQFSLMQNTSFPSKLIEYMSSARSIVIYGNKKNTASKYFDDNNLPQVIYGRDKVSLEHCIIEHINEEKDYSKKYLAVLSRKHSYEFIQRVIFMNM